MYKYFYKNLYKVKYGLFYLIDDNIFFINLKNSFCNKNIEILQGKCVINYLYKGFIYLWNNNEKLIFDINNSILKNIIMTLILLKMYILLKKSTI